MPTGYGFTATIDHNVVTILSDPQTLANTYSFGREAGGDITISLPSGYSLRGFKFVFLYCNY